MYTIKNIYMCNIYRLNMILHGQCKGGETFDRINRDLSSFNIQENINLPLHKGLSSLYTWLLLKKT